MINTIESDHNSHSAFLLYYHLLMVIKYRRKIWNDERSEREKESFEYIAPGYGIVLEEWNHDTDHVHVMFRNSQRQNSVNSSMPVKVSAADC